MRDIFGRLTRHRLVFSTASLLRLGFALYMSLTALTNAAQAAQPSNDDTATATMQVFVGIAELAGAPIPKEAVPVVQGMVSCALAGTSLPDCARNIAISTALSQVGSAAGANPQVTGVVREAVTCLTGGGSPQLCLTNAAVSQLPREAQPLASCIGGGGDLPTCAERAALTVATQQLGANLPPAVNSTVQCVIGGGNLQSCASSLVTEGVNQALRASNAPPEVVNAVNGMVNCVSGGGNAATCARQVAVDNIPPGQAHDFAACMNANGASAQTCVANFAASNISDPTARTVVGCMGQGGGDAVQQCIATNAKQALGDAASQAAQQALVTAANTIASLQLGMPLQTPPKFPEQPAILQNILSVAHGIQQGDWSKVVLGVGAELAEVAGKIILSIFLTPALANVLAPVVDAMIQNDVNAFVNGVGHLKDGDAVGVAQDIFKWYETQYIQAPCALLPNGAFRDSVCNALADGINWVADTGGKVAKDILGVGKDVLAALGLWNTVDDVASFAWKEVTSVVDNIGHFLGIGHKDPKIVCIGWSSPADYFNNNVVGACLASATSSAAQSSDALSRSRSAVVNQCAAYYEACPTADKKTVEANCGKMGDALSQMAGTTAGAMRNAAAGYARTAIATFAAKKYAEFKKKGNPEDICSESFWPSNQGEFDVSCAAVVGAKLHMPADTCPVRPTYDDPAFQACATTVRNASYLTSSVAGPKGALCKKFMEDAKQNPCQFTTKTSIVLPSGQVIATHLECSYIKPPWIADRLPLGPKALPAPWANQLPKGGPVFRLPRLPLPDFRLPPITWVNADPTFRPCVFQSPKGGGGPAIVSLPKLPLGGGNGGGVLKKLPESRVGGLGGGPAVRMPSQGVGGSSSSRAMDTLGDLNTGGAMGGAAGTGSGGIGDGRRPGGPLPPTGGVPPKIRPSPTIPLPGVAARAPSGGSGGIGMVNGQSGNAPTGHGGSNTVNSQSGNSPSSSQRYRPVTKLGVRPSNSGPDNLVDYGGCSSCNTPPAINVR